jgi:hypothetical protein
MSQNNYIDFIKSLTLAKDLNKQPSVLNQSLYTDLKRYSLSKSIPNTKLSFSNLSKRPQIRVFNMDISVNNCINIQECINTNTRPNRQLNPTQLPSPTYRLNKVYTPTYCTFINGQVTRKCVCSKTICKCGIINCN